MGATDEKYLEMTLPNQGGCERIAMASCASFAKTHGFAQERIEDMKTAVSEACMNAFEHGNRGRPDAKVVVRMSSEDRSLIVWVVDEGAGLAKDPPVPSIERKIEGKEPARGFGMFLIRQLADKVTFEKLGNHGHAVRMVFEKKP